MVEDLAELTAVRALGFHVRSSSLLAVSSVSFDPVFDVLYYSSFLFPLAGECESLLSLTAETLFFAIAEQAFSFMISSQFGSGMQEVWPWPYS